ncbi:MAG: T9SS type A sorting domain-containing protein, partial [Bacteroidales bacterium]|nr:T9SS type A sorting domain-containing protein [Bacteroidales bacterium]
SPNSSYSEFGISVSISGNYIVVGAKSNSTDQDNLNTLNYAGAAYIFENTEGVWSQTQKIVAFDRATYDAFGQSVSITDGYLVVSSGSYNDELGENPTDFIWGGAYIYEYSNGIWDFMQKITTQNKMRYSRTALSVSIDNQSLIVSAEESDEIDGLADGGAYIFENANGTWEAKKSILFTELLNNDYSFTPVSISGNNAVIGAPGEDSDVLGENFLSAAGSIYFMNKSTNTGFNNLISKSLNVYPNPSDGHLMIEGNFGTVESLRVSDISGRSVFEQSNPIFSNSVDISNLDKGIYFIEIQSNKQSYCAKIVLK